MDLDSNVANIAEPAPGVPIGSVLAAAASAALGSPLPLPLESLLAVAPAQLPAVAAELAPGGLVEGPGAIVTGKLATWHRKSRRFASRSMPFNGPLDVSSSAAATDAVGMYVQQPISTMYPVCIWNLDRKYL